MAKKRPTIRGKGADLFLSPDEESQPAQPTPPTPPAKPYVKATFTLPPHLAVRLDDKWAALRTQNRRVRVTKSAIVAAAIEAALNEHDENPDTSTLANQLYGKQ